MSISDTASTIKQLNPLPNPTEDFISLAFIIAVATAVNVTARIRKGKEPASIMVSALVLFIILAITGNLFRYDIVLVMAALFLVSSLVINGKPFVDGIAQFLGGIRKR